MSSFVSEHGFEQVSGQSGGRKVEKGFEGGGGVESFPGREDTTVGTLEEKEELQLSNNVVNFFFLLVQMWSKENQIVLPVHMHRDTKKFSHVSLFKFCRLIIVGCFVLLYCFCRDKTRPFPPSPRVSIHS